MLFTAAAGQPSDSRQRLGPGQPPPAAWTPSMHVSFAHLMLQMRAPQSLRMLKRKLRAAGVDDRAMPPLTWLFDCAGEPSVAQLDAFATYGQGLGPDKVRSSWRCAAVTAATQKVSRTRAMLACILAGLVLSKMTQWLLTRHTVCCCAAATCSAAWCGADYECLCADQWSVSSAGPAGGPAHGCCLRPGAKRGVWRPGDQVLWLAGAGLGRQ